MNAGNIYYSLIYKYIGQGNIYKSVNTADTSKTDISEKNSKSLNSSIGS